MRRAIVCDRNGTALFDLPPAEVFEMSVREEVNGEHSLTVTTTRTLDKGWRILTQNDRGRWREHVVFGTDALHDAGERAFGTYYCTWSLQHDLMGTHVSEMPGVQTPCTAAVALDAALSGTARWARGTVTNTNTGGASMYDTDGWSAIAILVGTWGGELDTTIEVDDISRTVTAREVDYYDAQGDQEPKRRYDFGADLSSVRRTIEDGPLYCRMSPRGKGEETEGGGYGRRVTIESVNGGKDYLENAAMTDLAKLPNGSGGWEYPTIIAENSECETPTELKAWAEEVLEEYTVPKVTYDIDVVQLAREGVDIHGVSLGDAVHVVDRKLGGGMGIAARVLAATTNLLNEADVQLTLGHMNGGLAGIISGFNSQLATVSETVKAMNGGNYSTADYLERLVDRINAEINSTGGYAYIVPGNGILTFDVAVADPLNPVEASRVVEIKGGTIRIANTKTAQGAWEWKTVFTSGHVAAELVTAAQLVAGYIGSATSGTYWDLDNNLLSMGATTILDGSNLADSIEAAGLANTMIRAYNSGVLVCKQGNTVGALVNSNGSFDVVAVTWSGTTPTAGTVYASYGTTSTIGQSTANHVEVSSSGIMLGKSGTGTINVNIDSHGVDIINNNHSRIYLGGTGSNYDLRVGRTDFGQRVEVKTVGSVDIISNNLGNQVHIGTEQTTSGGVTSTKDYYSFGSRLSTTSIGSRSFTVGTNTASALDSVAFGFNTVASGATSCTFGDHTQAGSSNQFVCGRYNSNNSSDLFEVGSGTSSSRANAFRVTTSNTAYVGSTQVTSDRRVKTPLGEITETEATEFVRQLKPSKFEKFGRKELGFYAQDVEETNLGAYLVDESNDHGYEDFKNLSYDGLIAPLVAYAQSLEARIEKLEQALGAAYNSGANVGAEQTHGQEA